MKFSALNYYLASLPLLLKRTRFWKGILIPFLPQVLIKIGHFDFFTANLLDYWTLKEVILDDVYEVKQNISQGSVVIDIGASIGDFSILSESLGAKQVFAYESDSNRVKIMRQNLDINNSVNVTLIQKEALSLDKIFKNHRLEKCNFLKIDCEGCEYQILKNGSESISKVDFISMEAHLFNSKMERQFRSTKQWLKDQGFKIRVQENPVHSTICYLFAKKNLS